MRHFVVYPSADYDRGVSCARKWMEKGYEELIGLDSSPSYSAATPRHVILRAPFPGYYRTINWLVDQAFSYGADLVTCIGDDMEPPTQGAQFIAEQYFSKFPDGFGVMQPCGDPQGDLMVVKGFEHLGPLHNAGRICGSPVFGRAWSTSGYKHGGFHDGYRSFYGDEDLWNRAMNLGVLWLDRETMHLHNHWSWGKSVKQPYHDVAQKNWLDDQQLFLSRKAEGFQA